MQKMFVWWQATVILTYGQSSLRYLTFDMVIPSFYKYINLDAILSVSTLSNRKGYVAEAERMYRDRRLLKHFNHITPQRWYIFVYLTFTLEKS